MGRGNLRLESGVQHHPPAVDDFVLGAGIEDAGHVAVLAGEGVLPACQLAVEFAVLALPVLDVGERADVDGLLEELVDLGEGPEDLDVVGEGAQGLWLVHGTDVVPSIEGAEPACFHGLVLVEEIVAAGQLAIDVLLFQRVVECCCGSSVPVEHIDDPEQPSPALFFYEVLRFWKDHSP